MNGQYFAVFLMCRFHHQALVELKILDVIKRKDKDNLHNVIHMKEYFYFRNHLCISFELLGSVGYMTRVGLKFLSVHEQITNYDCASSLIM